MSDKNCFVLTGARVVDPAAGIDEIRDVGVDKGLIVEPGGIAEAERVDVYGLVVAPGFIDIHVHLRQPGQTAKETIKTGTMAAAAGGFTTIVAMPNTAPVADTVGTIDYLKRHAKEDAVVKLLPCGAMTKGLEGEEMAGIGGLRKAGCVAISDDGKCIQNHEIMRHVVEYAKTFNLPILDHCEDDNLVSDGIMHEGYWSTVLGVPGIPSAAEELMIARDAMLARMADWKIHIQHVSAKESVGILRYAQGQGIQLTAEVTPHHICLTDECIKYFDSNYKMNPPLRAEDDRQALIQGLKDGVITVIATDHAPHTETEKLVELSYAPFGIVGLETAVPVCLTELYHAGHLSLSELIEKFTTGPAAVLGAAAGTLAIGAPADITILDINAKHTINAAKFFSKSRNTPFHGREVRGEVKATIVDGKWVFSRIEGKKGVVKR